MEIIVNADPNVSPVKRIDGIVSEILAPYKDYLQINQFSSDERKKIHEKRINDISGSVLPTVDITKIDSEIARLIKITELSLKKLTRMIFADELRSLANDPDKTYSLSELVTAINHSGIFKYTKGYRKSTEQVANVTELEFVPKEVLEILKIKVDKPTHFTMVSDRLLELGNLKNWAITFGYDKLGFEEVLRLFLEEIIYLRANGRTKKSDETIEEHRARISPALKHSKNLLKTSDLYTNDHNPETDFGEANSGHFFRIFTNKFFKRFVRYVCMNFVEEKIAYNPTEPMTDKIWSTFKSGINSEKFQLLEYYDIFAGLIFFENTELDIAQENLPELERITAARKESESDAAWAKKNRQGLTGTKRSSGASKTKTVTKAKTKPQVFTATGENLEIFEW